MFPCVQTAVWKQRRSCWQNRSLNWVRWSTSCWNSSSCCESHRKHTERLIKCRGAKLSDSRQLKDPVCFISTSNASTEMIQNIQNISSSVSHIHSSGSSFYRPGHITFIIIIITFIIIIITIFSISGQFVYVTFDGRVLMSRLSLSVFLLVLSSCYLAFRVCRLEQQLSFLSSQPTLRERCTHTHMHTRTHMHTHTHTHTHAHTHTHTHTHMCRTSTSHKLNTWISVVSAANWQLLKIYHRFLTELDPKDPNAAPLQWESLAWCTRQKCSPASRFTSYVCNIICVLQTCLL